MRSHFSLLLYFLLTALICSCFQSPAGVNGADPSIPQKLVIIHTTDAHSKFFPFWMEPGMFDRDENLTSKYPPCWDINWDGGGSYCDAAFIKSKDKYKVYESGHYVYLSEEELNAQGIISEDTNRDGVCDINDCGLVWDRNRNNICDFPYNAQIMTYNDNDGNPVNPADRIAFNSAKKNSEDVNRDGVCDYRDYHPGQANTGGAARVATVFNNIRKEFPNFGILNLNSGDSFQGAPEFNLYKGDLEMMALQKLGIDAMAIGNHEFDNGAQRLMDAYGRYGGFPLLAANYILDAQYDRGLHRLILPYIILFRDRLKIGIIGIGNESLITSIQDTYGSLGFNAMDAISTAQTFVDALRGECDLIILLSHQGLDGDYALAQQVKGVDIILGGHHHVVLDPAKVLKGPDGRDVIIVHSGVDFKAVGQLQVIVQNKQVVWHDYQTVTIDDSIAEDPVMETMLIPYKNGLATAQKLDQVIGRATATISRSDPNGGDSPLGNIVTDAMMLNDLVRAECAVTNSLGIRADIPAGDITREKLYEVFPFENTITTMYLSGREMKELFDFIARKSSYRGCVSQVQVSGINVEIDCTQMVTKKLRIGLTTVIDNYELLEPFAIFKMATNDYMAKGGSGFYMLQSNTASFDTEISLRDSVIDLIESAPQIDPADYSSEGKDEKRILMSN